MKMSVRARFGLPALVIGMVALALILSACIVGAGAVRTESRNVSGFSEVQAGGGIELTVSVGAAYRVTVTAEENVLAVLTTEVDGGVLTIGSSRGYTSSHGVKVVVAMPDLASLALSGGSQAQVSGVERATLALSMSGGSQATVRGSADTLEVEASGGSRAHLRDLAVTSATVQASGGAGVEISASGRVDGDASGGSSVDVYGGATLSVETSGGAEVHAH